MFFGFSLRSYALVGKDGDYVEFNSSFYRVSPGTAYTFDNPVTKTNSVGSVSASITGSDWDYYSLEYHIVTSKGDFVVASSYGSSSASLVSVLYLSGSPVGYYGTFRGQVKSGVNSTSVTLSCSSGINTCTDESSVSSDVTVIKQNVNTINTRTANIYNDTQEILDLLQDFDNYIYYISDYKYFSGDWYANSNNTYTKLSGALYKSFFTVNSTDFDYLTITLFVNYLNGTSVPVLSKSYTSSSFSSLSSSDTIFNLTNSNIYYDSAPVSFFIGLDIYGSSDHVISFGNINNVSFDWVSIPHNPLNVAIPFVEDNWDTIASSDELAQLNIRSEGIDDIILGNNDFENGAFEDLTDGLNDFGFSNWSLVPIATELNTTKNIITMFYNVLPFKIQWLFTSVMALGLIMMLLTVGTRVVQRTGDFTRAKPVKMSYKHKGK